MATPIYGVSKVGEVEVPATWEEVDTEVTTRSFSTSLSEKRASKEEFMEKAPLLREPLKSFSKLEPSVIYMTLWDNWSLA